MRKIESLMVDAVRDLIGRADFDGTKLRLSNTEVVQCHYGIAHTPGYEREISILLHNNEIATIYPATNRLIVRDCGWQTVTTKSRLNAILQTFTAQKGISQCKGEWLIHSATGARYDWNGEHEFPLAA